MRSLTRCLLAFVALSAAVARPARAQNVDSLAALLASPQVRVRAAALTSLRLLSPAVLAPAAPAIISLLEREALGTATPLDASQFDANDDTYKEYVVALSGAAVATNDPRATRGLALLGIQTSRAAKMFVIAQGSVGVSALEEAWNRKASARPDVMAAWGLMLAPGARTLPPADRGRIMAHLLSPDDTFPLALRTAARNGQIVSLGPVLRQIADTTGFDIVRESLTLVADQLAAAGAARSPAVLLSEFRALVGGMCDAAERRDNGKNESGRDQTSGDAQRGHHDDAGQFDACKPISARLADAAKELNNGKTAEAKEIIRDVLERVKNARREKDISPLLADYITGTVTAILARMSGAPAIG